MKKLDKILDNVMRFLMAVAMFALLAGGTWQIFTRWILRNPSTMTDEFLRYVLIWASMIGSAYCFYKDKHLALDLVKGRAKGAFNVVLSVFIEAAIVFFVPPTAFFFIRSKIQIGHQFKIGAPILAYSIKLSFRLNQIGI